VIEGDDLPELARGTKNKNWIAYGGFATTNLT
jgi:hypothetical protein